MPMYEYVCSGCGHYMEDLSFKIMTMDEDPGIECEECKDIAQRAILTAPHVRGSNWGEGYGKNFHHLVHDVRKKATDMRYEFSKSQQDPDKMVGESPYSNMKLNPEHFVKQGTARRMTPEEKKRKEKNMDMAKKALLPRVRRQYKNKDGEK